MKIILADDDPFSMALVERKIQSWGYDELTCLNNGTEALKLLKQREEPLCCILDWMMPGLNGNEVFLEIGEDGPGIYKILLTAKNSTEDMLYGLNCGAQRFLTKPMDYDELRAALIDAEEFLSQK